MTANTLDPLRNRLAVLFTAGLLALLFVFLYYGGDVRNALVPTAIGFCLEGLIFITLLERYEAARRHEEVERSQYVVRKCADKILQDLIAWMNDGHWRDRSLPGQYYMFMSGLATGREFEPLRKYSTEPEKDPTFMREKAFLNGQLSTMRGLAPVVADVNAELLDSWLRTIAHLQNAVDVGPCSERYHHLMAFGSAAQEVLKETRTYYSAPTQAEIEELESLIYQPEEHGEKEREEESS